MKPNLLEKYTPYLIFIFLGFLLFPSTGRDDIYISYWSAYTLANFGEIVNYNGERVEQSSSLLHTLLLAFLHRVTQIELPILGNIVSIGAGMLTLWLAGILANRLEQPKFPTQLLSATTVPLLYWSFGGLETALVSASILWIILATSQLIQHQNVQNYLYCIIAIAAYLLLRPEAFFVISCFLIIIFLIHFQRKLPYQTIIALFGIIALLFISIVFFRYSYFHAFFPQPVEAKVGMDVIEKLSLGMSYYQKIIFQYPAFVFFAIPTLFVILSKSSYLNSYYLFVTVAMLIAYNSFIVVIGGDWMEGGRFFAPIISLMVIVSIHVSKRYFNEMLITLYGFCLNVAAILYFSYMFSTSSPITSYISYVNHLSQKEVEEFSIFDITNRIHYRDIPFITNMKQLVKTLFASNLHLTIMSGQGGMVPYYLFKDYYKQIKFIDIWGLSTRDFTQCKITNSLPKGAFGVWMGYDYFFKNFQLLSDTCKISKPDIIYDLDPTFAKSNIIENYGYTMIYFQTGEVRYHYYPRGWDVRGEQFIAVRTELVDKSHLSTMEYRF